MYPGSKANWLNPTQMPINPVSAQGSIANTISSFKSLGDIWHIRKAGSLWLQESNPGRLCHELTITNNRPLPRLILYLFKLG